MKIVSRNRSDGSLMNKALYLAYQLEITMEFCNAGDHSSKDVPVNVNNKMQSQEIAALTKQITSLEKRQDRYNFLTVVIDPLVEIFLWLSSTSSTVGTKIVFSRIVTWSVSGCSGREILECPLSILEMMSQHHLLPSMFFGAYSSRHLLCNLIRIPLF
jgi:hypothetical protein